jgi:two-component system phosphate regulon sensor histidine kinase PhoR
VSNDYTVLVADDERVIREGCSRILGPEGYRVLTACNGSEALDMLGSQSVNVVLCDLKMPVMGAMEVLEETGGRYPDIPVIIITGHGTVENAVECMKKGAYDLVTKPFRSDHLGLIVKRALEKQDLERQTRRLKESQARNLYDLATEKSRIHTIINCMADGVLVTNRGLEVVLCNPVLRRLLGISPPADSPALLSDCLEDQTLVSTLQDLLAKAAEQPEELISREMSRGGAHLRALSALALGPDREVLGTVTVLHDITKFKELDAMKSSFVHMVAHELRSPLSTIRQQHDVLLGGLAGELREKQKEMLDRSRAKIDGLLSLINDLLDVAKIESGHGVQQLVPLKIEEILGETVQFMKDRAEAQKIVLTLVLPEGLPPVRADHRSMEEVFTNLISNAINYSPDGGEVTVTVSSKGDYVCVSVRDTGIGIAPEELPKIFEKFYRVKHQKTRQVIGTGLGLAIIKGIIEAHNGTIEVESTPGIGTTFRLLLPVAAGCESFDHAER